MVADDAINERIFEEVALNESTKRLPLIFSLNQKKFIGFRLITDDFNNRINYN